MRSEEKGIRGPQCSQHKNGQPKNAVPGRECKTPLGSDRPTYQPEVVLQHLKRDHGCIGHTTEAAFLRTYEKETQRRTKWLFLVKYTWSRQTELSQKLQFSDLCRQSPTFGQEAPVCFYHPENTGTLCTGWETSPCCWPPKNSPIAPSFLRGAHPSPVNHNRALRSRLQPCKLVFVLTAGLNISLVVSKCYWR